MPLSHSPGHAQADFGEADVVIGGIQYRAHYFVMSLPHSDAFFVCAYPAATTEAWLDGHNRAFCFFGGVPKSILYDNDRAWWLGSCPMAHDNGRGRSAAFSLIIFLRIVMAVPARAMTKAMWKGWSATRGGTS